jgi:hypothetical protein
MIKDSKKYKKVLKRTPFIFLDDLLDYKNINFVTQDIVQTK